MIHREGEIQTWKGCGGYNRGKFIPADIVGWYGRICQQVVGWKNPLRWSEILRAIAGLNPPLKDQEEWGESVYSFLANGNQRIDAAALDQSDRKKAAKFGYASRRSRKYRQPAKFPASSFPLGSENTFTVCLFAFCY